LRPKTSASQELPWLWNAMPCARHHAPPVAQAALVRVSGAPKAFI
jgi:hypothetical protein